MTFEEHAVGAFFWYVSLLYVFMSTRIYSAPRLATHTSSDWGYLCHVFQEAASSLALQHYYRGTVYE